MSYGRPRVFTLLRAAYLVVCGAAVTGLGRGRWKWPAEVAGTVLILAGIVDVVLFGVH